MSHDLPANLAVPISNIRKVTVARTPLPASISAHGIGEDHVQHRQSQQLPQCDTTMADDAAVPLASVPDEPPTQGGQHEATENGTAWTPPNLSSSPFAVLGARHRQSTRQEQQRQPSSSSSSMESKFVTTSTAGSSPPALDPDSLPGRRKSRAGIALRSWFLGQAFGTTSVVLLHMAYHDRPLWRVPFFVAALSLFHFLEFWTTARYNTRFATVSAFLLTSNGTAYNIAHAVGLTECLLTHLFPLPTSSSSPSSWSSPPSWFSALWGPWPTTVTLLGLALTAVGQFTRSCAMAHAGTSFNHIVQTRRSTDHQLVTSGIYAYLRHPSYFGFFWWALGTQVVMGNRISLVGYALVLWRFFSRRIASS